MNLADLWNIVWQDTPFHWAIAAVLVFGIGYEILITASYLFQNGTKYKSPRFVTTLCTSIGVLGTFYGIQQGLQNINLGDISNSQQLMTSSIELLGNMKTAFSTSLMGLGCGSLFTLVLFLTDFLRQLKRDRLRNNRTLNNQQPPSADEIGKAVGTSIAKEFTQLNQLTSEAIGKAVGKQMEPLLGYIFQEQKKLRKQLEENQGHKLIEKLIQDLRVEVIEPVAQKLDESAALTQRASQAVTNLHNKLGDISQSLASSIQTIQNFQQETLVELKDFANELKQTLNDFQTDTKDVLQQTGIEINRAVEQSIQGMTAQRQAFRESANQAAVTFRGIRGELEQSLHTQTQKQQEMLEGVQNSTQDILNTAKTTFKQQTDTITAVGNQASELMRISKEELEQGLVQINGMLNSTNQNIQQQLEEFRQNYQARLEEFFNQSSQGITAQRTAFEESASQAAVTFRGIRGELEQSLDNQKQQQQQMLQRLGNEIAQILNRTTTVFEQQNSNLERIGNQASELMNDASNNLLATLENIDEKLAATRQTVQDNLTRFREEYQTNLNNFFEQQNQLLERTLGQQRDGLAEVVNNLNTAFQEEYTRRSELSTQVNQSMNQISEAATDINQLACAVGLNSSNSLVQLENVARDLNQQVQGVRRDYGELSNTFQESLTAWTNNFSESREQFFEQADSSMAKVCSSLLQTAKVLVAAKDNRNNGNGSDYHE